LVPPDKTNTQNASLKKTKIDSKSLANMIANAALEKKGEDIKIFDLTGLTDITDQFVIVTGSGNLHVKAIVDHIQDGTDKIAKPWHIEGYEGLKWVLLDYVNVVLHVFDRNTREYYDIERLWADAEISSVSDEN